jgi:hypothetical protein
LVILNFKITLLSGSKKQRISPFFSMQKIKINV